MKYQKYDSYDLKLKRKLVPWTESTKDLKDRDTDIKYTFLICELSKKNKFRSKYT